MNYEKLICPYSEKELEAKYNAFIDKLSKEFKGSRLHDLLYMYTTDHVKQNIKYAPASSVAYFHNAYCGGYLDHINNVVENSKKMFNFYKRNGGTIDFKLEELVFAAYHHDLGKVEDGHGNPTYEMNDSDWDIKKKQMFFKKTQSGHMMQIDLRTFYILNKFGIKYSEKEALGIQLADGMYEEGNERYLKGGFGESKQLQTNLPHILHAADMLSSKIEKDQYYKGQDSIYVDLV